MIAFKVHFRIFPEGLYSSGFLALVREGVHDEVSEVTTRDPRILWGAGERVQMHFKRIEGVAVIAP